MSVHIVLSGASSVGKTTLANDWCYKHKHFKHIQEVARDVMKKHEITRDDMKTSLQTKDKKLFIDLQHSILEEQNHRELAIPDCKSFISDRGPDPLVFVDQYVSEEATDELAHTTAGVACLERYRNSLVVVLCPLAQPSDDGFRFVPTQSEQNEYTKRLCKLLCKYRIPYIYVDVMDRDLRMSVLENAVRGKFALDLEGKECPFNISFTINERRSSQDSHSSLRVVHFTQGKVECLFKPFPAGRSNRMIDRYGAKCFVVAHFDRKISPSVVRKALQGGLLVNGEEYQFLGCSSSGLRNRTCYMYKGTVKDVQTVLNECGLFSEITSLSVKLKRIGQLFSEGCSTGIQIPDQSVVEGKDIIDEGEVNGRRFNFTDGCGAISVQLAKRIKEGAKLTFEPEDYLPCVYQIRYQGCKGVIMIDPRLKPDQMMIRNSMKKFKPGTRPFPELWLCDYSQPYSFGHLNKQFVMLFSGLGVKDSVFLKVQRKHFSRLESMMTDPANAVEMLQWNNQSDLAAKIARSSPDVLSTDSYVKEELSKLKSKLIEKLEKLRLMIPKSRNVFGVCDPFGILEYEQCFFRPTIRGKPMSIEGFVAVAKNPCYLLGDVRRLKAVAVKELEYLTDCIVFPTKGRQPHPNEIAGSDLDGDQYFVCWEKDLIPPFPHAPYDYPASVAKPNMPLTMIDYFAHQDNSTMGKIDAYFKYWADVKGIDCEECKELGKHFSLSVDSVKSGDVISIPPHLRPPKGSQQTGECKRVWKIMEQAAVEKKRELSSRIVQDSSFISKAIGEEFIWSLVQDEQLNMSEFQIFQFVQRWCYSQEYTDDEAQSKLLEFSDFINFSEFTVDEQVSAVNSGVPLKVVTNALNKSQLLTPSMWSQFSMDSPHCGWQFYFRSDSANFDSHHLLRAVKQHPESMIVLQLSSAVSFAVHFLSPLECGTTKLKAGSAVVYFFSPHFGVQRRHVLGPEYSMDLDSESLQLYRREKQATFIWLGFESKVKQNKSKQQHHRSRNPEETVYDRISVDLTQFKRDILTSLNHPKVYKESFRCIEVFVRRGDQKPAYFDIHTPETPDNLHDGERKPSPEVVEDLPCDSECEDDKPLPVNLDPYLRSDSLEKLQMSATKGNLNTFQAVLQIILSNEGSEPPELASNLQSALLTLLSAMVARFTHTLPSSETVQSLQAVVTSLYYCFMSPQTILELLDRLCRLHCPLLAKQASSSLLASSTMPNYFQTISSWQIWCFLPEVLAHHILDVLKPPPSVLTDDQPLCEDSSIQQLAVDMKVTCTQSSIFIEQYTSHFANLLLHQFIDELANLQSRAQKKEIDDDHVLVKLKAYDYKNPHQEAFKDDDCSNLTSEDVTTTAAAKTTPWIIGFTKKCGFISKKFTVGTYVMISPMSLQSPVAIGRIREVSKLPENVAATIVVEVKEPVPYCLKQSAKLGRGHWQLSLMGNVTALNRSLKALQKIVNFKDPPMDQELLHLVVHPQGFSAQTLPLASCSLNSVLGTAPSSTQHTPINFTTCEMTFDVKVSDSIPLQMDSGNMVGHSFSPSQQRAIAAALSQRLTLIHGPPGTGKTYVACEIVHQTIVNHQRSSPSVEEKGPCVLVAAETNMAVDNLTRKLLQHGHLVVRVGSSEHISSDVLHVSLERQLSMKRRELDMGIQRYPNLKMSQEILKAAQVVTTTCIGAGDPVLNGLMFSIVVIDEATQATEPTCLVPIVNQCKQLILIGDPQQLSPTMPTSTTSSCRELSIALFHRLYKVLPSFFLEEQHRMHPALADFPSKTFYEGKLKTAASLETSPVCQPLYWPDKGKPLTFINVTSGKEQCVGKTFRNVTEAQLVVKIVSNLLSSEVGQSDIAILTPYAGQVKCIKEMIASVFQDVLVSSVDAFQGREKPVIIFSTVRTRSDGNLDFVCDKHRINVLLTRAMHGIIGVGSCKALSSDPIWQGWLQQVCVVDDCGLGTRIRSRPSLPATRKNKKYQLCKFVHRQNGCRHGDKCYYAHSKAELNEWNR